MVRKLLVLLLFLSGSKSTCLLADQREPTFNFSIYSGLNKPESNWKPYLKFPNSLVIGGAIAYSPRKGTGLNLIAFSKYNGRKIEINNPTGNYVQSQKSWITGLEFNYLFGKGRLKLGPSIQMQSCIVNLHNYSSNPSINEMIEIKRKFKTVGINAGVLLKYKLLDYLDLSFFTRYELDNQTRNLYLPNFIGIQLELNTSIHVKKKT